MEVGVGAPRTGKYWAALNESWMVALGGELRDAPLDVYMGLCDCGLATAARGGVLVLGAKPHAALEALGVARCLRAQAVRGTAVETGAVAEVDPICEVLIRGDFERPKAQ